MKPILFNTQMVRAVLDGRKTVTRRAVKPQPPATSVIRKRGSAWNWSFWADCDMGHLMQPPYQPGDILWVRETWNGDWCDHYIYKADGGSAKAAGYAAEPKWRPSIHMPKEAARLTAYRKANGLGCLAKVDALAGKPVTDELIRELITEGKKIPMEVWRQIGAALDALEQEDGHE